MPPDEVNHLERLWKTPVFNAQRRPNAMYVSGIEKAIYLLKLDSANQGALPLTLPVCFPNDDNNETSIKLKYYPLCFSEVLLRLALVMVEWKIKKMVSIELWLS